MATKKKPRFKVLPARGLQGKIKKERWNVCLTETKEIFLGPYHTRTAADIVCSALNAAESDREK